MHPPISVLPAALLAFVAGATALQWCATLPGMPAVAALTLAAAAAAARAWPRRHRRAAQAALALAALAGGFAYAAWRADARLADALPPAWEGVDLAVVGVVDELPVATPRGTRFAFAVERVDTAGAVVPSRLSLAWYAGAGPDGDAAELPAVAAGERWRLTVRLKRPHGTVNPHGFDVEAWMLENGLRASGYVRADAANARLDAFAGRPGDWVQRARAAVRGRIDAALGDARYAGVIVALAIGEERAIPQEQWQVFNRTGIGHLISISGLHVTAFAALVGGLVHALARRSVRLTSRLPARKLAAALGVVAAALYVALAGAQVPAQRTVLMLAVAGIGLWVARPGTAALVWLWALAVVVAWDPWAALTPGFWLSFGAVGLLLYAGSGRLASPPPATRRARLARALAAAGRAQALITVGLVPLTLALFQQVSLVAPLANALAIPVVTFAVVPVALAGIVLPFAAPWQVAHAVFAALMAVLTPLSALPDAVWAQHAPAPWAVAAALVGVAWIAAPRGVPGRALGVVWLLPLFVVRPLPPAAGTFHVTVLDVGQGLAVVVQTQRHALLYDTGPRWNETADAGGRIVVPYLRAAGIERLSMLVVSHQDADHSGGARSVLQAVPVERFVASIADDHPLALQYLGGGGAPAQCVAGASWTWDDVRFSVLHPQPAHYADPRLKPNDLSCVVSVDGPGGAVLLTGDLEARGELELVARAPDALAARVLVVPHHGSRTSSTPAFIAAVAPEVAIFTPGYRNRFGHPRPDIVARYAAPERALRRTDLDGALSFDVAPGRSLALRAEREHDRRYWRDAAVAAAPALD